jgi:plastocyanin
MKGLNLLWLVSGIALTIQGCGVVGSRVNSQIGSATAQNKLPSGTAALEPAGAEPTSLQLTVAPCDSNFNCVPGMTATPGQVVKIAAHVAYAGVGNPTGQLCIVDNGSPVNCGLTPITDEEWFTNSLLPGKNPLTATYAGDSAYAGSTTAVTVLSVGVSAGSAVASQLTANPPSLNFGSTTVGTSSSLPVTLTNHGNSPISISNVTISGPGFSANGVPSGTILSPGQSVSLNVTLAPAGTGSVSGSVTLISNAANSSAAIGLAGAGVQATVSSITLSPADPTIAVGNQVQFTAVDNIGNDITSSVVWSSSNSVIATITAGGLARGVADGPVTITARQ